ncbi:4-(cytidine 5'-diphospho)-2-C-methyl-D-erythritol kinase [Porphyromonas levii]|uniref:4-diphosphocytidyl-2-C-methyl-D-erythritol kinase n=1 Tax=Porphyromonas levii TaxID=28114 RepID=A0A4Y8WQQ0_9PORP|nr:4-(cytidine 5'-diphospho)-2-C-methyl-D-erythritol kinase [Porphyromonas levii]MBR8703388.1 4-diphosphocytidyl-2-C-methyl-D-erythritol kinase [Porphyromonas levii]MBR8713229.1 4-diphosphocytidyl-2-C-methyl-D-erythritol kinase [Porphyromonas levii]MBR8715230.1 4-diphosphocytidyl-2-C-methyl-D-erythritol kinase [Porphyromonas levii]MBR8727760.1 4-diphosphocytidyl-2-C-methyl-D-erythritol kinase [Porphyromonas levii]MBR8729868.1 4-diphosphocytidyl-2-C-methyl-D-erythritol kinase [Porphyromonas lev
MIVFPKAKINLGLRVLRKRADGYHDLQTLLYPIPLRDSLEILPADRMRYDFGTWGEPAEDNLVVRAYRMIQEVRPELPPVEIILRKRVPTGAGLGGGSSDATNMLMLLNRQFQLGLSYDDLHPLATRLGADCPFFLRDEPQMAEGIGEVLTPYGVDLSGKVLTLLLSDIHVSTAEAYGGVQPHEQGEDVAEALQLPLDQWRHRLVNDFEPHIFAHHPTLAEGKEMLYRAGAIYAAMSGSGSTLFGISEQPLDIRHWNGTQLTYTL